MTDDEQIERDLRQFRDLLQQVKAKYTTFEARRDRLRWLIDDTIGRLERATGTDFGGFQNRIDELGYVALACGFELPPIQRLHYDRDGENSITPHGRQFPACPPMYWVNLKHLRPEVVHASGYRANDPAGFDPAESFVSALVDCDDPKRPKQVGENPDDAQAAAIRAELIACLRLWASAADGLQAPAAPNVAQDTTAAVADDKTTGEADGDPPDPNAEWSVPLSKNELARRYLQKADARGRDIEHVFEKHGLRPNGSKWETRLDGMDASERKRMSESFPKSDS